MGTLRGMSSIFSMCFLISSMPHGMTYSFQLFIRSNFLLKVMMEFQSVSMPRSYPTAFVSSTPSLLNRTDLIPALSILVTCSLASILLWFFRPSMPRKIYFCISPQASFLSKLGSNPIWAQPPLTLTILSTSGVTGLQEKPIGSKSFAIHISRTTLTCMLILSVTGTTSLPFQKSVQFSKMVSASPLQKVWNLFFGLSKITEHSKCWYLLFLSFSIYCCHLCSAKTGSCFS